LANSEAFRRGRAIIHLILQVVAGAIGSHAVGCYLKNIDFSPLAKLISRAIGGGRLRHLTELDPSTRVCGGKWRIWYRHRTQKFGWRRRDRRDRHALCASRPMDCDSRIGNGEWNRLRARRPYAARGVAVLRKITFVIFFDIRIVFAVISAVGFDRS
jgi:hypothetical protein